METSDITLIRVLTECGSISSAVDVLCLSQPTISRKLARLESRIGTRLFDRSSTGLTPTPIAKHIVSSSTTIENQLKRIDRYVEQLIHYDTGAVRLGVGPIIEQVLLPQVLPEFVAQTGAVQLSILTENADRLIHYLYESKLDVIAGPFDRTAYPDLTAYPLITDDLIAVARAGHPLFRRKGGSHDDIFDYPLASPAPQGLIQSSARFTGHSKQVLCENYPLLLSLTLNSDAILRGPRVLFIEELDSGGLKLVESESTLLWRSVCLVKPESADTPLVKLMIHLLQDACRAYPSPKT